MQTKNQKSKRKNLKPFNFHQLETILTELLLKDSWKVYSLKQLKDGCVYITATKKLKVIGYFKIVCQVVNYSSLPVTVHDVRQLELLISKKKADRGLIVSFNKLTPFAFKSIKKSKANLDHVNVEDLIYMCCQFPQVDDLSF